MEAAATDVTHVADFDAFIAVNRCWFPEVLISSENGGHHNERGSAPQSISMVEQAHLPGSWSSIFVSRQALCRKAHSLYTLQPACLEAMVGPSRSEEMESK